MSDRVAEFLLAEMKDQKNYYDMFYEMFFERSQLYGTLIHLMLDNNTREVTIKHDDLRDANNFILKFIPDRETDTLKIQVVDNPDKEKDES